MSIASSTYHSVLRRDEYICRRCYNNQNLTLHHIRHKEHGGTDHQDNLITLCFSCHRGWHTKYDRWPKSKLVTYIEPENEVDILLDVRQTNISNNLNRNYSICNANEVLPRNKKRSAKTKGKQHVKRK